MKKSLLFFTAIFMLSAIQIDAYAQRSPVKTPRSKAVDYSEVPRISAYKAYVAYKAGKAIILHAGGEIYERRHIMGAMDVIDPNDPNAGSNYKVRIPKLPKKGIEIFTYCY